MELRQRAVCGIQVRPQRVQLHQTGLHQRRHGQQLRRPRRRRQRRLRRLRRLTRAGGGRRGRVREQREDGNLRQPLRWKPLQQAQQRLHQRTGIPLHEPGLVHVEGHGDYPVRTQVPEASQAHDVIRKDPLRLGELLGRGGGREGTAGEAFQEAHEPCVALRVLAQEVVPRDRVSRLRLGLVGFLLQRLNLADSWREGLGLQAQSEEPRRNNPLFLQQSHELVELIPRFPPWRCLCGCKANHPQRVSK
mmetsp:Transcript_113724/g.361383  ORF Transcript_113724/g.361383 Transcript_113724/m.361383 type:complete len:248 (+) Transcript_113724:3665-4408(+)